MKKHDDELSTEYLLLLRYRRPYIDLKTVCQDYLFNIKNDTEINRKAAKQGFPFPVFRSDPNSSKSPYLVKITELAAWLDSQAEQGKSDWEKVNS